MSGSKSRCSQQTQTIPLKEFVDKVRMSNSRRPRLLECFNRLLNTEAEPLDQIGADEKSRSVKPVVAVTGNDAILVVSSCFTDRIDEFYETRDFVERGGYLGNSGICDKVSFVNITDDR